MSWQAPNTICFGACYFWNVTTHAAYGCAYTNLLNNTLTTTELNTTYLWTYGCLTWVSIVTKVGSTYYYNFMGFLKKFFASQTTTTAGVTAGSNVTVTVADATQLVAGKQYQIMGVSGEGRDRVTVSTISGSTITIASLPRNYGSGAIIGETPAVFICYYSGNNLFQEVSPVATVGLANGGGSNDNWVAPFNSSYINPDARAEQRALLMPAFLLASTSPYGVAGYVDDYFLFAPAPGASAVVEDLFGVNPQDLTGAGKGTFSGTSIGTGNDGTHFNDTRTYSGSAINWTTNAWTGYELIITGGTGAGQSRQIASNGSTQLVLASPFTTIPDATSTYAICQEAWRYFTPTYPATGIAVKETL